MQLLDADAVAANVSTGASAVVDVILEQAPKAQVLLLALLPRGDRTVEAPPLRFLQPSKYVQAVTPSPLVLTPAFVSMPSWCPVVSAACRVQGPWNGLTQGSTGTRL